MFRCCECGCEYKEKPDFCDCGNDTFDEVYETLPQEKVKRTPIKLDKSDILSWLAFGVCLILSVLVLLFFPKITEKPVQQPKQEVVQTHNPNIPDLNTFWIESKPVEPIVEIPVQPVIEQIKTVFTPKPEVAKQVKPVVKQTPKPQKAKTTQPKPVQQVQKPVQTQQVKKTTTQQAQQVKTSTQPVKTTYTYEVLNYRTALRQRLLNNLNLYKIEGSGKCGIEFTIDENGKLLNRRFMFQSDNKSVNDEVYKMLMRTPSFNPPPASYVNKKIRMTFNLDSQSYEIKYLD